MALDPDGGTVRERSAAIPIVTVDGSWADTGGCSPYPQQPLVADDGTIFVYNEADSTIVAVDPSLKAKRGWPYELRTSLVMRDERYVKEDAYCPTVVTPAVAPDGTLYLPLQARAKSVEILDGDVVRENLSKGLGFSRGPRHQHPPHRLRRRPALAHGVPVITAAISPYKEIRDEARELMGDRFVEVYIEASVDACAERDVKGLYAKAFSGEIKEFTGVSDPYEAPREPRRRLPHRGREPAGVGAEAARLPRATGPDRPASGFPPRPSSQHKKLCERPP